MCPSLVHDCYLVAEYPFTCHLPSNPTAPPTRRASNNEAEVRRVEALLMPALACSLASCGHAQMLRSLAQVVSLPYPRPRPRPRHAPARATRPVALARSRPQGVGVVEVRLLCERRCCERRCCEHRT